MTEAAARYPRVHGRCPMGCGDTLFLGKDGYVTCGYLNCPNPGRVDQLLAQFEGRERYMVFVTKESDVHWMPNTAAAPPRITRAAAWLRWLQQKRAGRVGFVTYQGTAGSPNRLPMGWDK